MAASAAERLGQYQRPSDALTEPPLRLPFQYAILSTTAVIVETVIQTTVRRFQTILSQFLTVGLFIAGTVCFIASINSEVAPYFGWLLSLVALWFVVLVHEMGHAVSAAANGWRVAVFVAGPLGFHVENREFAYVSRTKRLELAGYVLPYPSSSDVWTRKRAICIYAGGPAASALFTIALAILALLWAGTEKNVGLYDPSLIAAGLAIFSLAITVGTLLPAPAGKHPSDGQSIARLVRTPEAEWRKTRSIIRLAALVKHKLRLRDLPLWMLEDAQTQALGMHELEQAVAALTIGIVLDSAPVDTQSARQLIDEYRRMNGDSAWLSCCDAYLAAVWENDPDRGRTVLWKAPVDDDLKPLRFAAEAAVKAREGSSTEAKQLLAEMRSAIGHRSAFTDPTFNDIESQVEAILLNPT